MSEREFKYDDGIVSEDFSQNTAQQQFQLAICELTA